MYNISTLNPDILSAIDVVPFEHTPTHLSQLFTKKHLVFKNINAFGWFRY